jgi:hypothetical protein
MFPAFQASPAPVALNAFILKAGTTISLAFVKLAEKDVACKSILADKVFAKNRADSKTDSSIRLVPFSG